MSPYYDLGMKTDWVVVGAGFTGATFAERLAVAGRRVLLVDARDHIGGNAYDEHDEHGILVHRYGPHIFHTNSSQVWEYLSRFTEWRPYQHHVLGCIEGHFVPIPFNLNSLTALFPTALAAKIEDRLVTEFGFGKKVPILKLREAADETVREFADYVYRNVFEQYTIKQWGLRPEELSPSVTARVPVYISRDDRYFQDTYQAMPLRGYTALFRRMISHPNIKLLLNCDFKELVGDLKTERIFYSGAIDELLDYRFGPLPYRSLRFEPRTLPKARHQPAGTVNYPNNNDFTRITEQKTLTGQTSAVTTLITEYPQAHEPGRTIAYYPIPRDENKALHDRYVAAAEQEFSSMIIAGRLGDYQYYNMDQACARGLMLAAKWVA